jgi:hypothetical protein
MSPCTPINSNSSRSAGWATVSRLCLLRLVAMHSSNSMQHRGSPHKILIALVVELCWTSPPSATWCLPQITARFRRSATQCALLRDDQAAVIGIHAPRLCTGGAKVVMSVKRSFDILNTPRCRRPCRSWKGRPVDCTARTSWRYPNGSERPSRLSRSPRWWKPTCAERAT